MANTILELLNFNPAYTANHTVQLSNTTTNTLNATPVLLNNWQLQDVLDSNVGGYLQNPLLTVSQSIEDNSNTIVSACYYTYTYDGEPVSGIVPGLEPIYYAAIGSAGSANNFIFHTNRISGVTDPSTDNNPNLPHYKTAIAAGKGIIHLMNKNESLVNNAPILGSFTSLLIGNTLNQMESYLANDANTVQNSISHSGGISPTYSSNLTPTQISTITANIISISTLMDSRVNNDVQFFQSQITLLQHLKPLKLFDFMGQTENYLVNNLIGTEKLMSRLNSQ